MAINYLLRDNDVILSQSETEYVLRFKDMPSDERPRERLLELGPSNLSLAELVAIVWGVGHRGEDVLAMAKRTLKEYGDKTIGYELDPKRLSELADIPLVKACQIVASFELGRRFYARQAGRPVQVRNAKQAYEYLKDMGHGQKEQLRGLYLNSLYQVIHDEVISVGSLTSNIVHPREVFQPAIERGAIALILAHNHPSGRLEPTLPDIEVTKQLIAAGQVLGIDLLDHLIITDDEYCSILDYADTING
ncbi:MAG TPA: DNA repair protein RadC [Candidatus Saccharimonadales bacterium]|jgi:DNA repair protein RadC|nr:DNA repair protein RadC [Candidatus Saccharimonadales bacterium]